MKVVYIAQYIRNDGSNNLIILLGVTNPEDIQHLKDHVISRLATAYSLEKMRRALDKLKQSVDKERHLEHNEIEGSQSTTLKDNESAVDKAKRVAIKKEKVQFDNNQ